MVTVKYQTVRIVGSLKPAEQDAYDLKDQLINKHRDDLPDLIEAEIFIGFNGKPKTSKGRQVYGVTYCCSDREKLIHGYDFQIILDSTFWGENPTLREPLLFHELRHCQVDVDPDTLIPKFSIRRHDLEIFNSDIEKYGYWLPSFVNVAKTVSKWEQKCLPFDQKADSHE